MPFCRTPFPPRRPTLTHHPARLAPNPSAAYRCAGVRRSAGVGPLARYPARPHHGPMERLTRAILDTVRRLGWTVTVRASGRVLVAERVASGELVEIANDDPYVAAVRLAERVGIDVRE